MDRSSTFLLTLVAAGTICVVIGVRGLVRRRAVVLSGYWFAAFGALSLVGMMIDLDNWGSRVILLVPIPFLWRRSREYVVVGVTSESLERALQSALKRLNMKVRVFGEKMLVVELTTLGAEVRVDARSRLGIATLSMKRRQRHGVLRRITHEMRDRLSHEQPVEVKEAAYVFYAAVGLLLVAFVSYVRFG